MANEAISPVRLASTTSESAVSVRPVLPPHTTALVSPTMLMIAAAPARPALPLPSSPLVEAMPPATAPM